MAKTLNDEFWYDMAQDFIRQAEKVKCSLGEFKDGLGEIIRAFKERRDLVEDELDNEGNK